ncbi:uncharacterized protein EI97DRAFT_440364 [Westerdykella ornata]|uniref:Uncharacterized protein n=1 Tax=Westerdykella ornata TaxID=318751 RepID=A0A6A6JSK0_WESOR|nr:uncharacterized protein EI97DRAFT_440364 [Westerdykella ornata]KAF2278848.1 hypothetical protein EI97DRAFT_440364 [Westerdykella ornata]
MWNRRIMMVDHSVDEEAIWFLSLEQLSCGGGRGYGMNGASEEEFLGEEAEESYWPVGTGSREAVILTSILQLMRFRRRSVGVLQSRGTLGAWSGRGCGLTGRRMNSDAVMPTPLLRSRKVCTLVAELLPGRLATRLPNCTHRDEVEVKNNGTAGRLSHLVNTSVSTFLSFLRYPGMKRRLRVSMHA